MKILLLSLLLIGISVSCKKEVETVNLEVSNIRLVDVGQVNDYNYSVDAAIVGDSTCECKIRTIIIKKGDSIASLNAYTKDNELHIDITSSPFDFDCNEDSCFTYHDLYFNLNLVNKKEYYVNPWINNGNSEQGQSYALHYVIK